MKRNLLWVLLLVGAMAANGCTNDDITNNNRRSGGNSTTTAEENPATAATSDAATPADPNAPVTPGNGVCDPKCASLDESLCVYDASNNTCVECTEDKHCQNNLGAYGDKCDTKNKTCMCKNDGQCKATGRGNKCYAKEALCTCSKDADCTKAPYTKCEILDEENQLGLCAKLCKADADCLNPKNPRCDVATGACVACSSNADCANNPKGTECVAGRCGCANAQGCSGQYNWANECAPNIFGENTCSCKKNDECTGNPNGGTCNTGVNKCACTQDGDCTKAPYTKCAYDVDTDSFIALLLGGVLFTHCQPACTGDADCFGRQGALNRCDPTSAKCVQCLEDAHCAGNKTNKYCLKSTGICVPCKTDGDCTNPAKPFCNQDTGYCKECLQDTHCDANANGKKCVSGACGCDGNTACAGVQNGTLCDMANKKCSCGNDRVQDNANCPVDPFTKCAFASTDAKYATCQKPCAANADCAKKTGLNVCDVAEGKCVGCVNNSDCKNPAATVCDTSVIYRACVQCTQNSDCLANAAGTECNLEGKVCTCNDNNASCQGQYPWGNVCLPSSNPEALSRCGCTKNDECAGNAHGPACSEDGTCSCATDAECKNAPYTKCALPKTETKYRECKKACATDADCGVEGLDKCVDGKCVQCAADDDCAKQEYLKMCSTEFGQCVDCKANTDCTNPMFNMCNPSYGCVQCFADADCTDAKLGNKCQGQNCVCETDADCLYNQNGHTCDKAYKVCSCKDSNECATGKKCKDAFGTGDLFLCL